MSNNLLTSMWGPLGWGFIHSVAMGYPDNVPNPETDIVAQQYKKFFLSLGPVLPCVWCKQNYEKNISQLPIDGYLGSRNDLMLWTYKLHNLVNDETKVPANNRPSFSEVLKLYEKMNISTCNQPVGNQHGTCHDPYLKKRCKIQYLDGVEEFGSENSVFAKYWYLVLIIVVLIVVLVVLCLVKIRKK